MFNSMVNIKMCKYRVLSKKTQCNFPHFRFRNLEDLLITDQEYKLLIAQNLQKYIVNCKVYFDESQTNNRACSVSYSMKSCHLNVVGLR